MPTNVTTTNQGYEKPYPSNLLAEDVLRLQNALDAIDTDMAARPDTATVNGLITTAVNNLIAGAPQALDTLNELSAALGDDSAFATTVTTALAARLQLSGGTMTGDIDMGANTVTNAADPVNSTDLSTKQYTDTKATIGLAVALG